MSKIITLIRHITPFAAIFGLSCLFLLPFLLHPVFNLIDDGLNLQVGQRFVSTPTREVLEQVLVKDELALGRMRPLYFLFYVVLFAVVGPSATGYWGMQLLLLVTTLSLTFVIINSLTRKKWAALLGTLALLIMPSFAENYFRLGTAETKQVLPMLLLLIWLMRMEKRNSFRWWENAIAAALFTIPLFIKETAIVMFGWLLFQFAIHWLQKEWIKPGAFALLATVTMIVIGFFLVLPHGSGYSSSYVLSWSNIKESALVLRIVKAETIWLVLLALGLFGLRVGFQLRTASLTARRLFKALHDERWLLSCMVLAVGAIGILLPWKYKLERYFYFIDIMLVISLTSELLRSYDLWKKEVYDRIIAQQYAKLFEPATWLIGAVVCVLIFSAVIFPTTPWRFDKWPTLTWQNLEIWYTQYQYSGAITSFLLTSIPENATLLVDYADYEVIYELGIFASRLSTRPVIVVSPNPQVEHDFHGIYHTSTNLRAFDKSPNSPTYVIARGAATIDVSDLHETTLWPNDSLIERDEKMVWRIYQ